MRYGKYIKNPYICAETHKEYYFVGKDLLHEFVHTHIQSCDICNQIHHNKTTLHALFPDRYPPEHNRCNSNSIKYKDHDEYMNKKYPEGW